MPKNTKAVPRDVRLHSGERSVRGADITMTEWLDAIGGNRPPLPAEGEGPVDLRDVIARALQSVAASTGAGNFDKAARLLRELRATDEYLRQRGDRDVRRSSAASSVRSMTADADEWLEAFLESGERPASEAYAAGKAAGFSEYQLKRAKPRIGVRLRRVGMPPKSYWRLAGTPTPPRRSTATNDDDDLYADVLRLPDDRGVFNPDHITIDRWLRDFLKDGPKPSSEVYRRGLAAGFPARDLRNARQRIGALIHQRGYPCRTTWLLRGQNGGKS